MSSRVPRRGRAAALITLLASCLPCVPLSGLAPDANAAGPRLTVRVSEPFEFQGRVWPASTLSLVTVSAYNPMATLDEIWIGAECLGRMVADRLPVTGHSEDDVIVFERNAMERLVLVGYALRGVNAAFRYRPLPSVAALAEHAVAR